MAAQPARVALIGYGPGGAVFHAPYIAATPGLKLAAIVTANPQRRAQAKHEFPGTALLRCPDEIWVTAGDFDLVVVATPNVSHVPLALDALEAGLTVVVDKPLAPSAAEARRLVAAVQKHELLLTVFHSRRWDGDSSHRTRGSVSTKASLSACAMARGRRSTPWTRSRPWRCWKPHGRAPETRPSRSLDTQGRA